MPISCDAAATLLLREETSIVQISPSRQHPFVLVSSLKRSVNVNAINGEVIVLGSKARNGAYGACWGEDGLAYAARPGRRIWKADPSSGNVSKTLIFPDPLVAQPEDGRPLQLSILLPVPGFDDCVIAYSATHLAILQLSRPEVLYCDAFPAIICVAVTSGSIYLLRHAEGKDVVLLVAPLVLNDGSDSSLNPATGLEAIPENSSSMIPLATSPIEALKSESSILGENLVFEVGERMVEELSTVKYSEEVGLHHSSGKEDTMPLTTIEGEVEPARVKKKKKRKTRQPVIAEAVKAAPGEVITIASRQSRSATYSSPSSSPLSSLSSPSSGIVSFREQMKVKISSIGQTIEEKLDRVKDEVHLSSPVVEDAGEKGDGDANGTDWVVSSATVPTSANDNLPIRGNIDAELDLGGAQLESPVIGVDDSASPDSMLRMESLDPLVAHITEASCSAAIGEDQTVIAVSTNESSVSETVMAAYGSLGVRDHVEMVGCSETVPEKLPETIEFDKDTAVANERDPSEDLRNIPHEMTSASTAAPVPAVNEKQYKDYILRLVHENPDTSSAVMVMPDLCKWLQMFLEMRDSEYFMALCATEEFPHPSFDLLTSVRRKGTTHRHTQRVLSRPKFPVASPEILRKTAVLAAFYIEIRLTAYPAVLADETSEQVVPPAYAHVSLEESILDVLMTLLALEIDGLVDLEKLCAICNTAGLMNCVVALQNAQLHDRRPPLPSNYDVDFGGMSIQARAQSFFAPSENLGLDPDTAGGGYIDTLIYNRDLEALDVVKRMGRITVTLWYLPYLFAIAGAPAAHFCVGEFPSISWKNVRLALSLPTQSFIHGVLRQEFDSTQRQYIQEIYMDYLVELSLRRRKVCSDRKFVEHYVSILLKTAGYPYQPRAEAELQAQPTPSRSRGSVMLAPKEQTASRRRTWAPSLSSTTVAAGRPAPVSRDVAAQQLRRKRVDAKIKDLLQSRSCIFSPNALLRIFVRFRYFKGILLLPLENPTEVYVKELAKVGMIDDLFGFMQSSGRESDWATLLKTVYAQEVSPEGDGGDTAASDAESAASDISIPDVENAPETATSHLEQIVYMMCVCLGPQQTKSLMESNLPSLDTCPALQELSEKMNSLLLKPTE
eukprot:NODE_37_length_4058_cov_13.540783_g31_i0.p1 GENE.NODE_37_length_4058_cov_13.540783_g31_i0~~NODE_37_length_4058_cov_13.540783_g31_i0.p1  ORF type:complete len:1123 (-),score=216.89 NODE_37_length_4058_cov_13.540783_g31_i0:226-3594(-)